MGILRGVRTPSEQPELGLRGCGAESLQPRQHRRHHIAHIDRHRLGPRSRGDQRKHHSLGSAELPDHGHPRGDPKGEPSQRAEVPCVPEVLRPDRPTPVLLRRMPGRRERAPTRSRHTEHAEAREILGKPRAVSTHNGDRHDARTGRASFGVEDLLKVPLPVENGLPLVRIVGVTIIDRRHTLLDVVK
jgi:hypothetical protein